MALINCPACGKEISDKAKECPQCGQILAQDAPLEEAIPILCEECGAEIPVESNVCPNCGCPVSTSPEADESSPQKVEVTAVSFSKNTKKYLIAALVAIVVLIAAFFVGNALHQQKLEKEAAQLKAEYESNIKNVSFSMLVGASNAETAGNLIKRVWQNAIYEERDSETDKYTRPNGWFVDDFNDALSNLFSDETFKASLASIETNQEGVSKIMRELKNPPEEYKDAYASLKELYDAYNALTNLALNPTGSLSTFSQNFNAADAEFINCYDAMDLYID